MSGPVRSVGNPVVPVQAPRAPEKPAETDPGAPDAPVVAQDAPPVAADQGDEGKVSKEPEADKDAPEGEQKSDESSEDEPLGPAGSKALGIWKERAKTAEDALKGVRAERDEALAKLADMDKTPEEQALAAAKREGVSEATATVHSAAAKAVAAQALIAEAKGRLADPSDAVAFLDVSDFRVGDDFTVDAEAISAAVSDLLTRKPHLKAAQGGAPAPVVPPAGIDQGVREKSTMTLADQIALARKEGRTADVIALKSRQLFQAAT